MALPRLVVYVLHWQAPERVVRTVESLTRSSGVDLEVTIIDNDSGSEALDVVRAALPGVRILGTGGNLGYAGAANVALADARGRDADGVALAAHDVLVEAHTLEVLAHALAESPSHAVVGPVLWDPSFDHPESVGGTYHPWKGGPLVAPHAAGRPDRHGIVDSTFVSGSLMLLRGSLLDEIDGMDGRLFAYWEDVDLCLQVRALGQRVGVVAAARAAETGYSAAHRTHAYLIARNHLLVTRRHFRTPALVVAVAGVAARAARAAIGSCLPNRSSARRATSWDFAVGRWRGLQAGIAGRGGAPPLDLARGRTRFASRGVTSGGPSTSRGDSTIDAPTSTDERGRRRLPTHRILRKAYPLFERVGIHVTPVHFYQPVPDTRTLGEELWTRRSELVGLDPRLDAQLRLLDEIQATDLVDSGSGDGPRADPVDAAVLRLLMRTYQPARIALLGAGPLHDVARQARHDVARSAGRPPAALLGVSHSEIDELQDGDMLLIDSSHVLHVASDVRAALLDVVPRLRRGVLVQVNDVYLPMDYPRSRLMEDRRFPTEQYALQAFLTWNRAYEVLWTGHLMHLDFPDRLGAAIPGGGRAPSVPTTLWFRRVG